MIMCFNFHPLAFITFFSYKMNMAAVKDKIVRPQINSLKVINKTTEDLTWITFWFYGLLSFSKIVREVQTNWNIRRRFHAAAFQVSEIGRS